MSFADDRKLTIRQWNTQDDAVAGGPAFVAMLNPAKYSRTRQVSYSTPQRMPGGPYPESRIDTVSPDTLELDELVLDGTGVVDTLAAVRDVDDQIAVLTQVLHGPVRGQKVRYAVVQVVWGTLTFLGRLTSMKVDYTLFDAFGTPLRARVKLAFTAYEKSSARTAAQAAAPQAQQTRVAGGDSLPLLCFKAYNDPALYQAVAMFNGLTSVRGLPPGAVLTLPKLR